MPEEDLGYSIYEPCLLSMMEGLGFDEALREIIGPDGPQGILDWALDLCVRHERAPRPRLRLQSPLPAGARTAVVRSLNQEPILDECTDRLVSGLVDRFGPVNYWFRGSMADVVVLAGRSFPFRYRGGRKDPPIPSVLKGINLLGPTRPYSTTLRRMAATTHRAATGLVMAMRAGIRLLLPDPPFQPNQHLSKIPLLSTEMHRKALSGRILGIMDEFAPSDEFAGLLGMLHVRRLSPGADRLLRLVNDEPGRIASHYQGLLGSARGNFQYALQLLIERDEVQTRRVGQYLRIYPLDIEPSDLFPVEERVLDSIRRLEPQMQKEIVVDTGLSAPTVSRWVRKMEREGAIQFDGQHYLAMQ